MVVRKMADKAYLVVGEGEGDKCFLEHVKAIYATRGSGTCFRIVQAYGGDASAVIKYARRTANHRGYSECGVLIDTDKGWGPRAEQLASQLRVTVVLSHPCLECLLLQIVGECALPDSAHAKKKFLRRFGYDAHDPAVYPLHFPRETLDEASARIEAVRQLIRLFSG